MIDNLQNQVEALEEMALPALRDAWRERFGAPPSIRSAEMLRLLLAWRIQAVALGSLDQSMRAALARTGRVVAEGQDLGVGAILRRTWNGEDHVVTVTENGFEWQGRTFRSLSAVATAIAGSRWNGPRFFGLRP